MEKIYDLFERYRDYILVSILFVVIATSEGVIYYFVRNDLNEIKNSINEKQKIVNIPIKAENKKDVFFIAIFAIFIIVDQGNTGYSKAFVKFHTF